MRWLEIWRVVSCQVLTLPDRSENNEWTSFQRDSSSDLRVQRGL